MTEEQKHIPEWAQREGEPAFQVGRSTEGNLVGIVATYPHIKMDLRMRPVVARWLAAQLVENAERAESKLIVPEANGRVIQIPPPED